MTDYRELLGLEENELPVDPVEEAEAISPADEIIPEDNIPEPAGEPTEAIKEQIEEVLDDEPAPVQISGRRVSILNREFEPVISKIDEVIGQSLCKAMAGERQGFILTAKIMFTPSGARFNVSHDVRSKMDPVEIKEKGRLYEAIVITLDENRNPIIPDGSSTQITMDEVAAGATVTTDADGVVQSVDLDEESFNRIFPCDCTDCPLHTGFTGGEVGCSFGGNVDIPLDDDLKGHIYEAVTIHRCTRGCINEICAREFPIDQPEPEPYPCEEADCPLCDFGDVCELHENGSSLVPYEDECILSAVEGFRCTRKFVRRRYGEIIEEGRNNDQDA